MATKTATNGKAAPANRIADSIVTIPAPNFKVAEFEIRGTAPLVQNKFPAKAKQMIRETQEAGSKASKKGKAKDPKDFEQCFREAQHISSDGWNGIPAASFRSAMIDACRLVGFKMTHAKLAVFILPDGLDKEDGTPLVKIEADAPEQYVAHVRNATGVVDLRIRPMWRQWGATVRVRFDADIFNSSDVANLLMRAGEQCGIGEGRPNSKQSHGQGFGTFQLVQED